MSARTPRADRVLIDGKTLRADVAGLVSNITYDFQTSTVSELAITAADPTGRLDDAGIGSLGGQVTLLDDPAGTWEIGNIEAAYGAGIVWTYRCRSRLAKALRQTFRIGAETKVSPTEWVRRRVRAAGGVLVAQPSKRRIAIGQGGKANRQSTLDVIGELAGELEWDWVEHGNTFYFGDAYWALTGGPGLPTWPVTWKAREGSDALEMVVNLSDDNTESRGDLDLVLPNGFGRRIRPWHRVQLSGAGRFSGTWLVESVAFADDSVSGVEITCTLPRKPAKKGGSS